MLELKYYFKIGHFNTASFFGEPKGENNRTRQSADLIILDKNPLQDITKHKNSLQSQSLRGNVYVKSELLKN
jgi:hypothetical protein